MNKKEKRRLWGSILMGLGVIQIINFAIRDINIFPVFRLDFIDSGILPVLLSDLNWPFKALNYYLYRGLGWTGFLLPMFLIALSITLFNKKETKAIKFRRLAIIWGVGELMLFVYLANYLSFVVVSSNIKAGALAELFALYLRKVGGSSFLILFFLYSFISYLLFVNHSTWKIFFGRIQLMIKNIAMEFGSILANNLSTKDLRDHRKIEKKHKALKDARKKKPARVVKPKLAAPEEDGFTPVAGKREEKVAPPADPPVMAPSSPTEASSAKDEADVKEEVIEAEYEVLSIKEFNTVGESSSFAISALSFNSTRPEDNSVLDELSKMIKDNFSAWGVTLKAPQIVKGPHLLRFDYEIPRDVNLKTLEKYKEELSYRMGGRNIDMELPIKGTDKFGIYVEREHPDKLGLREYFPNMTDNAHEVPFLVGVQADGTAVWRDAAKFPHVLVAGSTGSGKSVFLNTVILNLLALSDIKPVNLVLIDPKRVEFSPFTGIKQLACPIVTDVEEAGNVLRDAEEVMERRYTKVTKAKVRNIVEYNQVAEEQMPYLFIIVDELSDLLMQDPTRSIKSSLIRLAQKSRAVGIHLIVATQRPSSDIIDGLIKSNFPARIAFKTSSKVDSRIILDEGGAESLLGNGDMLEKTQAGEKNRLQGVYVSIGEIQQIVEGLVN